MVNERRRREIGVRANNARYRWNQTHKDDKKLNFPSKRDSVRDLWKVFGKGMSEDEYAQWYAVRYGMRKPEVLVFIRELKGADQWHVHG